MCGTPFHFQSCDVFDDFCPFCRTGSGSTRARTDASRVANDRLEGLRRELRAELPRQAIRVSTENGQVFLGGTVKDLTSSARAVQILSTAGRW
jgi:osmotically-inducible protein OsmY